MWIEIYYPVLQWLYVPSRPARALWIEIPILPEMLISCFWSRPARALWIEIAWIASRISGQAVEAREGLVD